MGFDVNAFLSKPASGATSTQVKMPPEGEAVFQIDDSDHSKWIQSGSKDGETWVKINIPCICLDDRVKTEMGRDRVVLFYDGFLDLDQNGGLASAEGTNVRLGQIRRATGTNDLAFDGNIDQMLARLRGKTFRGTIRVTADKNDPDMKRTNINRVVPV